MAHPEDSRRDWNNRSRSRSPPRRHRRSPSPPPRRGSREQERDRDRDRDRDRYREREGREPSSADARSDFRDGRTRGDSAFSPERKKDSSHGWREEKSRASTREESRPNEATTAVSPQRKRDDSHGGREEKNRASTQEEPGQDEAIGAAAPKQVPNFETSGLLTQETNTFKGFVIKYNEPQDAQIPKVKWRLHVFKGNEELPIIHLYRQSAFLVGRERQVRGFTFYLSLYVIQLKQVPINTW